THRQERQIPRARPARSLRGSLGAGPVEHLRRTQFLRPPPARVIGPALAISRGARYAPALPPWSSLEAWRTVQSVSEKNDERPAGAVGRDARTRGQGSRARTAA